MAPAGFCVIITKMTILFIDSENFRRKISAILKAQGKEKPEWHEYDFAGLFDKVLKDEGVDRKIFYGAKIQKYKETDEKSKKLIGEQRSLKLSLEKSGIEFIFGGKVVGNPISEENPSLIFKEKGVDVRLAIDMVEMAYQNKLNTAIIGSSDSDLQPAIGELKKKGVGCIYMGFEDSLNKGLLYTTNKAPIIIKKADVLEFLPPTLL